MFIAPPPVKAEFRLGQVAKGLNAREDAGELAIGLPHRDRKTTPPFARRANGAYVMRAGISR